MPEALYGPFGALAVLVFILGMIVRGDLVPGFIYRSEQAQRVVAETQALRNAEALAALAKVAANGTKPNGKPANGPPANG